MEQHSQRRSAEAIIRLRLREVRGATGMSANDLAKRCAKVGAGYLTRGVITKIENGQRANISVDDLHALACALDVSPFDLLVPSDSHQPNVMVTTTVEVTHDQYLEWIAGNLPLPTQDPRRFDFLRVSNERRRRTQAMLDAAVDELRELDAQHWPRETHERNRDLIANGEMLAEYIRRYIAQPEPPSPVEDDESIDLALSNIALQFDHLRTLFARESDDDMTRQIVGQMSELEIQRTALEKHRHAAHDAYEGDD